MNLDALAVLRTEFTKRGWHRRAPGKVVLELVVHVAIALVGYLMFLLCEGAAARWIGMAISTYGTLGVATNTHTSTHYGTSEKRWVNDLLAYFGYPFFLNLSLTYWRNSHIVIHHTAPNVMGVDNDADFTPWFVTTERELGESTGWARRYYERYQAYFFPIILWVHTFTRQKASWVWLWTNLRDPGKRRTAHWIDLACMVGYWLAWVVVPAFFLPLGEVFAASLIRIAFLGYPLFAVLAPAHYPHEAGCVRRGDWAKDFLALQTATTINYSTGRLGGFICSGLQYQIEHHLFPSYSHVYYPRMSPFVREFCERNGYPYRSYPWPVALLKVFKIFTRPKPEAADLDGLREQVRETSAAP